MSDDNPTPFKDFLDELDDDRRGDFLKSLSDTEIMRASASEEEFRFITGHDSVPDNFFENRPLKAGDVDPSIDDDHEDFQEMFDKFEKNFPPKHSIAALRKRADEMSAAAAPSPTVNVTISINELREKSQQSNKS